MAFGHVLPVDHPGLHPAEGGLHGHLGPLGQGLGPRRLRVGPEFRPGRLWALPTAWWAFHMVGRR